MKKIILSLLVCQSAWAGYDSSWHQAEYWSGEYPSAYSVIKRDVKVQARKGMDKDLAKDVTCELPYLAVFSPWNNPRNEKNKARYYTASKIVKLIAKQDFDFPTDDDKVLKIKKGQVIEYLIYGGEGYFTVRINGKEMGADQSLFEQVEPTKESDFVQEEWIHLECANKVTAWIHTADLEVVNTQTGETKRIDGISDAGNGIEGYGTVRDLTEKEAKEMREEQN